MRAPISSENGAIAGVRRVITFSIAQFFLGRCAWDRTLRTLVHARQRKRKVLHLLAVQVPRLKERRSLPGPQSRQRWPVHRLLPQRRPVLLRRSRQPARLLRARRRPRHLRQQLQVRVSLRLHQGRLLRQLQVRVPRHLRDRRGPSRLRASHQCIPLRGIMCIFIRRAVSILTQTCRLIVFSTNLAVLVTRVHRMLCHLPVPTRPRTAGKLFQRMMRNASWLT